MKAAATREDARTAVRKILGKEACVYDIAGLADELHRQAGTWDTSTFLEYPTRPGGAYLPGRRFWATAAPFKEVLEVCPSWCTSGPHCFDMTNDAGWPLTYHMAEVSAGKGMVLGVEQEVVCIDDSVNVYLGDPRIAMYLDHDNTYLDEEQSRALSAGLDRAMTILAAAIADLENDDSEAARS